MSWPKVLGRDRADRRYRNPAAAIQDYLSSRLQANGERGTMVAVAGLVEEIPQAWGRYVRGHVEPSARRIRAWAITQDLVLSCHPTGWTATAAQ